MARTRSRTGRILERTFDEHYRPIQNHLDPDASWNGQMFETFGAELEFVKSQPADRVWTWTDNDTGSRTTVGAGYHYVNRIGYFVTEQPHEGVEYFQV